MSLYRHLGAALTVCLTLTSPFAFAQQETVSQPDVIPCPGAFHGVALPDNARLCQIFDEALPASMVFHADQAQDELIRFYTASIAELEAQPPVSGRTLLITADGLVRLVISPDSNGSQVDILVTGS